MEYQQPTFNVLVADDEESLRSIISEVLSDQGYHVDTAANGKQALDKIYAGGIHVVITDIRMPEMTGIELLEKIKQFNPDIQVIIMTSFASIDTAVKAIRLGAYDYLTKPFEDLSIISTVIDRTVGKLKLEMEVKKLVAALKKKNEEIQNLYRHTALLFGAMKVDDIVQLSVQAFSEMTDGSQVIYYGLDKQKSALVPKTGYSNGGIPTNLAGRPPIQLKAEDIDNGCANLTGQPELRQSIAGNLPEDKLMIFNLMIDQQCIGFYSIIAPLTPFSADTRDLAKQYLGNITVQAEKAVLLQKVETMAVRDGLTELYNRRHFQTTLSHELERARRFNKNLSLIMFDIDNFKHYNDTNGHPMGDQLIKQVAKIFRDTSRTIDIIARYGGEEFVAILLETSKDGAAIRAENLRKSIATFQFPHGEKQPLGMISVSGGFAEFPKDASTVEELLEATDQALYHSKKSGRNRMTAAQPAATAAPPTTPPTQTS